MECGVYLMVGVWFGVMFLIDWWSLVEVDEFDGGCCWEFDVIVLVN